MFMKMYDEEKKKDAETNKSNQRRINDEHLLRFKRQISEVHWCCVDACNDVNNYYIAFLCHTTKIKKYNF